VSPMAACRRKEASALVAPWRAPKETCVRATLGQAWQSHEKAPVRGSGSDRRQYEATTPTIFFRAPTLVLASLTPAAYASTTDTSLCAEEDTSCG
jgi:hypothetical protein